MCLGTILGEKSLLTSGCCINPCSKMANMVVLELLKMFFFFFFQMAVIWEGFIINSRKPLKLSVFSNYQAFASRHIGTRILW